MENSLWSFSTLRLDLSDLFVLVLVEHLMLFNINVPNFITLSLISTSQLSRKNINFLMISQSAMCAFYSPPARASMVSESILVQNWHNGCLNMINSRWLLLLLSCIFFQVVVFVHFMLTSHYKVLENDQRRVRPEHFFLSLGVGHEHRKCIKRGCANDCRFSDGYINISSSITNQNNSCIYNGQG